MFSPNIDQLRHQDRYGLVAAKDDRVTRLDVIGAVLFNYAEDIASKEDSAFCGNGVPSCWVQVINAIGKGETITAGAMPIPVTLL